MRSLSKIALTIKIDSDLNRRFRIGILQKYDVTKGRIGKTIEEAIKLWLKENEEQEASNPSSKEEGGDQGVNSQG